MMLPRLGVWLCALALAAPQLLRAQSIDFGFTPAADSYVYALAAQPDGRIVVGGAFKQLAGSTRNFIGRLNPNGSLDPSFNVVSDGVVQCLVRQPDGKLLLGGQFTRINGTVRRKIARLNVDNSLDASFDPAVSGTVASFALQPDGRIVIGGDFETVGAQIRHAIARLNADGSVDAGFNPDATGLLSATAAAGVFSVALQADGKVVFGGQFVEVSGQTRNGLARVNADGTLDTTFNPSSRPSSFDAVVVQPDGKILVGGGFSELAGGTPRNLARLNPNGTLDPSFVFSGNNSVASIFLQDDGRVLVSGYFTAINGQLHAGWARLTSFGMADATFNFDLGASDPLVRAPINAVLSLSDGSMMWGGNFNAVAGAARSNLVRVSAATDSARLTNLSTRGFLGVGADLSVGISVKGATKSVLVRGIGPTLGLFGVTGALTTPRLEVIPAGTTIASETNTTWAGNATLASVFGAVGAFGLPVTSNDTAILTSTGNGTMTARVSSAASGGSGIALTEIYDRDPTTSASRLSNLSALGFAGGGAQALVPGFVISGTATKLLLIRAVGPGLAPFGVSGALTDPQLSVIPLGASTATASNDNWGGDATLGAAFAAAGAFALPANSRDAALIVRLAPGAYTVTVSGVGNTTGRVLVEIYDLDP